MKSVILEVGVNRGTDTTRLLKLHNKELHGFEPVPNLYTMLKDKFYGDHRVYMHNKAVGHVNETMPFYITVDVPGIMARHGASSLFQFRDDLKEDWDRKDFETDEVIDIEVIRLEDFIIENNIDEVFYLHCDAQGNDINVLRGLGSQAHKVRAGVVEATKNIPLYQESENRVDTITAWLDENGFKVTQLKDNDKIGAEINIYFERK